MGVLAHDSPARLARMAGAGLVAATLAVCAAAAEATDAYLVKAAFLYKFGSYVEWPEESFPDADAPFTVGVMGADELAMNLEELVAERTMSGRDVAVRRLVAGDSLDGLQMLFIGAASGSDPAHSLRHAGAGPMLVVTESGDDLPEGSTINFVIAGNKVRFDVSLDAAGRNGLKISSRLLAVARRVVPGPS